MTYSSAEFGDCFLDLDRLMGKISHSLKKSLLTVSLVFCLVKFWMIHTFLTHSSSWPYYLFSHCNAIVYITNNSLLPLLGFSRSMQEKNIHLLQTVQATLCHRTSHNLLYPGSKNINYGYVTMPLFSIAMEILYRAENSVFYIISSGFQ